MPRTGAKKLAGSEKILRAGTKLSRPGLRDVIREELGESAGTIADLAAQSPVIERMGLVLAEAYRRGNKALAFGNGGSACDAQHFADELVGRYRRNRSALPALSLASNPADLTSIANDFGYERVFARQLEAHAKPGDVAVAISTSGNSPNVLEALETAKRLGLDALGLSGRTGGKMKSLTGACLCVPSTIVSRIQQAHIAVLHILCEIVEEALFPDAPRAH